jgi:hypothetical protein
MTTAEIAVLSGLIGAVVVSGVVRIFAPRVLIIPLFLDGPGRREAARGSSQTKLEAVALVALGGLPTLPHTYCFACPSDPLRDRARLMIEGSKSCALTQSIGSSRAMLMLSKQCSL